ncbi:hypothetical protein Scep_024498 [Stephania cephalantha]|uniref:Uncharacterized protein n=1 Tax=Stephania cephalantha TaxID=152367 RepID=A0AAP0HTR1_9MAGN
MQLELLAMPPLFFPPAALSLGLLNFALILPSKPTALLLFFKISLTASAWNKAG